MEWVACAYGRGACYQSERFIVTVTKEDGAVSF